MDWYGGGDGIAFLYPFSKLQFGIANTGVHGKDWLNGYLVSPIFLGLELLVILPSLYLFFIHTQKKRGPL